MSDELKRQVVEKHWSLFPLNTSNHIEPINDYMNLAMIELRMKDKSKDRIVNTLNNTWKKMLKNKR